MAGGAAGELGWNLGQLSEPHPRWQGVRRGIDSRDEREYGTFRASGLGCSCHKKPYSSGAPASSTGALPLRGDALGALALYWLGECYLCCNRNCRLGDTQPTDAAASAARHWCRKVCGRPGSAGAVRAGLLVWRCGNPELLPFFARSTDESRMLRTGAWKRDSVPKLVLLALRQLISQRVTGGLYEQHDMDRTPTADGPSGRA